jgi:hypothetical protein
VAPDLRLPGVASAPRVTTEVISFVATAGEVAHAWTGDHEHAEAHVDAQLIALDAEPIAPAIAAPPMVAGAAMARLLLPIFGALLAAGARRLFAN